MRLQTEEVAAVVNLATILWQSEDREDLLGYHDHYHCRYRYEVVFDNYHPIRLEIEVEYST